MGKNEELGLPNGKMRQIVICVDVDGTLRDNTRDDMRPNERIRDLVLTLSSFKNVTLYIWSGSGELYARQAAYAMGLASYIKNYASKEDWQTLRPDIAIDDIQDTAIGKINLIVREK